MESKNKKEVKLVIFLDDDESKKEKYAIILERLTTSVKIQLCDKETHLPLADAKPFEIFNHRILKIKDLEAQ